MMGDHLEAFNGDGDASQLAYEKLFGGNEEWSQASSRMKKMMENDDEAEAANAILSHLKSPCRGHTNLSNLLADPDIFASNAASKEHGSLQEGGSSESGISIMARVLGKKSSESVEMPSPSKKTSSVTADATDNLVKSPSKRKSLLRHGSTSLAPATPQRGPSSGFFSTTGTPIGVSPGLRSLGASALLKGDGIGSTNLTVPFSPAPSGLLKGEGIATNLTVPYSPAPSMLFRALDEKTGDENRFSFDHHDARVCEDSNQLGDLAVGADLSNAAPNPTNGNSMIIAPEEYDAISGLGALSNSPFKSVKTMSQKEDGDANGKKPKSFFARVMGDSKEPSPQKKLF